MNCKLLIVTFLLFALLIINQANETYDDLWDISIMNEIESIIREARSFGCNGPNDRNPYRCKMHCRNRNYKSGRCTKLSNYTRCVCYKSLEVKPKQL